MMTYSVSVIVCVLPNRFTYMKNSIYILLFTIAISCQDDAPNSITEEAVIDFDDRFLKFSSFEEFNKLCADFNQKDFEYYKDWYDKQSEFVSLKYVYETLVEAENKFLEELALKHGEDAPLTR